MGGVRGGGDEAPEEAELGVNDLSVCKGHGRKGSGRVGQQPINSPTEAATRNMSALSLRSGRPFVSSCPSCFWSEGKRRQINIRLSFGPFFLRFCWFLKFFLSFICVLFLHFSPFSGSDPRSGGSEPPLGRLKVQHSGHSPPIRPSSYGLFKGPLGSQWCVQEQTRVDRRSTPRGHGGVQEDTH